GVAANIFADGLHSRAQGADDRRQRPQQRDEARSRHGARAHWANINTPEIAWGHLGDGYSAGINRPVKMRAKEMNYGHDDQPADNASGEERSSNARSDDVAHAEIFRRSIGADC